MRLYRTAAGAVVENAGQHFLVPGIDWHALTTREDLEDHAQALTFRGSRCEAPDPTALLAPIANQEVWAAGVTYYRSRTARMEESQAAGGGSFYDRVYHAERPELFFKALPYRVVGPNGAVHIRRDSKWNVPEPELALIIAPSGKLIGYTIGNDMSARDIEGENPLYLPQAKVYDRSCALGPAILAGSGPLHPETRIALDIERGDAALFQDAITLAQMKRTPAVLIEYLFRETSFPNGCVLLTGTGIVPPDEVTLQRGDVIRITIDGIGTLANVVD